MLAPHTERFLGRADALAELEDAYVSAVRGHPGLVLVTGDAGIGKSTLLARFTGAKTDARVLRGGCFGLVSTELPYGPVVQALRPLADDGDRAALSVDSTTLCAELGGSVAAVGEASRWSQSRLFESTLRLLGELARQRPLLLVLEDVHWADRATLDLLLFVLGNLVSERILILLTSREDEPDAPPWLEEALQRLTRMPRSRLLELGPLGAAEAAELVAGLAGAAPDAEAVRRVVERAEGNPFFLTELAGRDAAVPRRLRDLLLLRLQHLSPGGRRLVELLAAATTPLDAQLAVRVLGGEVPQPRVAVAEAYEARLVGEDDAGRLRLRHALLGEAVYAAMPPTERLSAHELLATVMDDERSDDAAAVVAYHWERAGRNDRVPVPLARAARSAAACFAFAEAARGWERLLELWDREPSACAATGLDRAGVLVELAKAHRFAPTPAQAVAPLKESISLLPAEPARAALAGEQLARQLMELGRVDDAVRAVEAAGLVALGGEPRLRARVESTHAAVFMVAGEYELSRQHCRLALELAGDDLSWERAHALAVLGVDLVNLGDVTGALDALDRAMAVSRRLDDPEAVLRIFVNQTYVLEAVGRYRDAARVAEEGLAFAEAQDMYVVSGALLLGNEASALIASGELLAARDALEQAVSRPGLPALVGYARLRLAEVDVALGHLDRAEEILSVLTSEDLGSHSVTQTQARLVRALLGLARSRPDDALDQAHQELARVSGGTEPVVGLHLYATGLQGLGASTSRSGRSQDEVADLAADLLKAAGTLRDQAPLPPCQDLYDLCALEYRECLGESDAQGWEELGKRLTETGRAGLAPYVFLRAAEARLTTGGRRAAEEPLREAWRLLERLGGTPLGRDVTALAQSCRIDLGRAVAESTSAPSPFGLTPRESEVLNLICDGLTNRQIARSLTISERTAGVHVSHILAKLHARNRAEAIAIAHRTGAVTTSS